MFAYGLTRRIHGGQVACGCAAEAKSHAVSGFLSPLLEETVQGEGFSMMLLLMSDDYTHFLFPVASYHRLIPLPTCF